MGVASGIPNASNFSLKGGTFLYPIQESVIVVFLRRQSSASRSGYGNRMERHFEVVEQNTRCAVERRRYAARRPRPRIPQFQGELLNTNRATNSMLGILSMGLLTWQLQAEVGEALPSLRVIEVGAHQRIWNTGDGHSGRSVVEIGSGMNYWDGQQWVPSDPSFEVTADAFVAERLQHKVHLKANLNKVGAVTVTTCDGITLRSTPVGIGLYDAASGRSAVIAAITDCAGVLVSSNKVVYENAFSGVCADVIYRIDRGSFEQDVLITGRLDPSDYGFPTNTTRLQIFTEFYQTPQPDRIQRPIRVEQGRAIRDRTDLEDEVLGFGEFVLCTGRSSLAATSSTTRDAAAVVAKEFTTIRGRTFLIESVES